LSGFFGGDGAISSHALKPGLFGLGSPTLIKEILKRGWLFDDPGAACVVS
jgi:hypothetical protein